MSNALVYCYDCDGCYKEKDCVSTQDEGYICYKCIKKRKYNIIMEGLK